MIEGERKYIVLVLFVSLGFREGRVGLCICLDGSCICIACILICQWSWVEILSFAFAYFDVRKNTEETDLQTHTISRLKQAVLLLIYAIYFHHDHVCQNDLVN